MNARLVRIIIATTCMAGFVVLVVTTADLVHLLHASLLLALGVGALLGRPRTG
jgi:hypothetical protein